MKDLLIALLMLSGAFLMLSASIGLLRMPDLFTRMQTATKAFTLGPLLILSGTVLGFATLNVAAKVLLVILFLYITAPIAGHLVGRAAYKRGVPRWSGTVYDEIGDSLGLSTESTNKLNEQSKSHP